MCNKNSTAGLTAFIIIFVSLIISSCDKPSVEQIPYTFNYSSFRDVPGVTDSEIAAVETLQKKFDTFIYGMPLSVEAFENEYGDINGFSALLCDWLTEFFGINFQPRLYEWLDLLEGLETGDISFSGELTATEERLKRYFMTRNAASRSLKYFTIAGAKPLDDIIKERRLQCGFITGTSTIRYVTNELEIGTYDIIQLDDVSLVYDALKTGKIDAFFYSGTTEANFIKYSDIYSNYFHPLIFTYVSLATQNPELAPIISIMDKVLENGGIRYFVSLYNHGEHEFMKFKLRNQLTEEEYLYIINNPIIPIGVDPNNYPGCFYDKRNNEWNGVFLDILDEITQLTGLTFRRVNNEHATWQDIYQMLQTRDIALVPELAQLPERVDQFLWSETIQKNNYYTLISRSDHPDIKINEVLYVRVGLIRNTAHAYTFNKWYPDHMNTFEYDSIEEAIDGLHSGKIDMIMANQNNFLYITHYLEQPGYKINVLFDLPIEIKIGLNKNEDVLCSIINKAFNMIDSKNIVDHWNLRTYDYRAKMVEAQRPWLLGVLALLLCVMALILRLFVDKNNEGKRLEKQVQERTIELNKSQKELETALKLAKAADISKSTFLANMSHEIRTPMNSIMGVSELAMDDDISPKTREYLSRIKQSCEWLLQIINDILDISKIESGKMELEKIPFDLHELFTSCRTLITPKADEKGITLYFYAEPSLERRPLGDPTRLRQVFINLLANAIKFTNTGMVKLITEVTDVSNNSTTIHFEVKDSGIGMNDEQINKIFEPFTQAESGTTRKYGGTGLGLTITKNIIEMMGGKLLVESTPGVGSKFYFDLTFETVEISVAEAARNKAMLNELKKPLFNNEIIVFEDNVMNQRVICEHLERVGIKSVVAENGKIGLDIIVKRHKEGKKPFDLIFMDMQMPVMDGFEASAEIMKLDLGVPIVAMTANVMSSDMEIYKKSGINDYVGKPFTSQELWRCLLKYLVPINVDGGDTDAGNSGKERESDDQFQRSLEVLFAKGNQKKYEEISEAIEKGDIKLAHRLAHTLKSNAAQLGKTLLQQASADIEHNLKDGINKVSNDQLKVLEDELSAVLKEFSYLLEEEALKHQRNDDEVPSLDPVKARELFEKLEPLLKSGNPECKKYADELRSIAGGEKLIQQMEDFEFEEALSTIEDLKGRL